LNEHVLKQNPEGNICALEKGRKGQNDGENGGLYMEDWQNM
jgi:hypothetical protein